MLEGPVGLIPPASKGGKYRDKSPPISILPPPRLPPPQSLGQRIKDPSYRVAVPTFPKAKLSAGPKEGCSGEGGSAEVVREGAGRSVLGWGERDRLGEVPERTRPGARKSALPRPRSNQKSMSPSSGPQVLARPRCPGVHGRSRERPLPRSGRVVG